MSQDAVREWSDKQLVSQMVRIRGRHLSKIDLYDGSYRPLEGIEGIEQLAIDYTWDQLGLTRGARITKLVKDAAHQIPNSAHRQRVFLILGLNPGASDLAQELRDEARVLLHEKSGEINDSTVLDRDRAAFLSLVKLMRQLAEQRQKSRTAGLTSQRKAPTAEETTLGRAMHHVVRTLRVRAEYAQAGARDEIDIVLSRFHEWPSVGSQDANDVLSDLDSICRAYVGPSVYDLMGRMKTDARPPEYPPHKRHALLTYPGDESLAFVPGGVDPFTGERVEPFYMAVFPVTMREWQFFLEAFHWKPTFEWQSMTDWLVAPPMGKLPAISMTFYDCVAYCFWLWLTTAYRFRLPTEAEWNFAATGGVRQRFPWGDKVRHDLGHFGSKSKLFVDELPGAGPHNIAGLAGNVWEYTSTLWRGSEPFPASDVTIPDLPFALASPGWWVAEGRIPCDEETWPEDVKLVMKGGSFSLSPQYSEVGSRIYSSFFNFGSYGGFRLAVSARKDERMSQYVPEPSPYVISGLERGVYLSPGEILANEIIDMAQAIAVSSSCAGGSGPRNEEQLSDWQEITRGQAK